MASALLGFLGSRVIHQETAHDLGGQSDEVGPAASLGRGLPEDLNVDFVDQSRGLEGVIGPLPPQLVGGQPPKVAVEQVEQPALCGSIPLENSLQQLRHLSWNRDHSATISDSHCSPRKLLV